MKLISDTHKTILNPKNKDLLMVLEPSKKKRKFMNVIRLEAENGNYIAMLTGSNYIHNKLTVYVFEKQLELKQEISTEIAYKLFKKFLRNEFAWLKQYEWKKGLVQLIREYSD